MEPDDDHNNNYVYNNNHGLNLFLLSSAITTLQKFAFVLYVGLALYNGTIFSFFTQQLIPQEPQTTWLSFLGNDHLEECKSLHSVLFDYYCTSKVLIVDDSEVHKAISNMSPRTKLQYLMIVRSSTFVAPYVLQGCIILTVISVLIFTLSVIQKALRSFGVSLPETTLQDYVLSTQYFSRVLDIMSCVLGSGIVSYLLCFVTSEYYRDCTVCEDAFCLYCVRRFSRTIFKDFGKNGDILSPYNIYLLSCVTLLTSIVLISLLYFSTIVFVCLAIHVLADAANSLCETGSAILRNVSSSSFSFFRASWNQHIPSLTQRIPSFRQLTHRLVHMHRSRNDAERM